jgi:hypothetical protein
MGICGNNDVLKTVMKINEATRVWFSSQGETLKASFMRRVVQSMQGWAHMTKQRVMSETAQASVHLF